MKEPIRVRVEGLDAVLAGFAARPAQIERAKRRAVTKTTRFVRRQALREMAAGLGIAQKQLGDRVRADTRRVREQGGVVWFGLNPLPVTQRRFGKLTQTAAGAKVRRLTFPGAFVATMPSGHTAVFERYGDKRVMRSGRYAGKLRQPIRTVAIPLDTAAHRAMVSAWTARAGERLREVLAQELNYEVNVRGGK